ncbi:MAG: aromatic amino acid transaminase [Candidatus Methylomirabilales bacterium]
MFESLGMAPPDPIFGLMESFIKDTNPAKVNLSSGVYTDASGKTPVLAAVKQAEKRILKEETTKSYKPIQGAPEFGEIVQDLILGSGHEVVASKRGATAHTPGGTAALRLVADYVKQLSPGAAIWLSHPTWANHPNIFRSAGLKVRSYSYFDQLNNKVDFHKFLHALKEIPAGDVVVLHGCCHNPTGLDPDREQWARIASRLTERKILPLVDLAYQGFGEGLEEDTVGLRELCRPGCEMMICSSFSKNFGLYNERVGALTVLARSQEQAQAVLSHVKVSIRAHYSNPPAHGGTIVTTILRDAELRSNWEVELREMRDRVYGMRKLFVESMAARGVPRDFSFVREQKGMFSLSGLSKNQIQTLRDKYSIYIVDSGRINVSGMTDANMATLCDAIASVL